MKELWIRLTSDTPTFFKKIIKIGLVVAGVGTTILALPVTLAAAGVTIAIPALVTTIGGYMFAGGTIAATIAKTAVSDTSVLPK